MEYKDYHVYDDDEFFQEYIQKRNKGNAPNEIMEQPIIDELIGDVTDKKILDLGCGDGKYGVNLLKNGAKHYCGVEGSSKMATLAHQNLKGLPSTIMNENLNHIEYVDSEFDLVISRLVIHYIKDIETLFINIRKSLKPEGVLIFSVEHPVITSCHVSYDEKTTYKRENWIVDNYFHLGERVNTWLGKSVVKYHRTLEHYWSIIQKTPFDVVDIRESKPVQTNFTSKEEYERRMRIPLFLIFKLRKD